MRGLQLQYSWIAIGLEALILAIGLSEIEMESKLMIFDVFIFTPAGFLSNDQENKQIKFLGKFDVFRKEFLRSHAMTLLSDRLAPILASEAEL